MSLDYSALRRLNAESADPLIVEAVRWLYLFEGLDTAHIGSIVARCPIAIFPAGMSILVEWDDSNGEAYVILNGKVEVSIGGEVIATLSDGAIFGEYALVSDDARTATVRAIEPTQCLTLDETACLGISDKTNRFNEIMLDRIEENMDRGRGVFRELPK